VSKVETVEVEPVLDMITFEEKKASSLDELPKSLKQKFAAAKDGQR
jgi:hypothetical protein